jgi:AraC family transcriptional regulator, regulatory protein of adaptative response / methylated-DNA-[protein]-cysteine methyltransferase
MRTTNAKPSSTTRTDPRWTAILEHDPSFDGQFFYAVKTTGVYCRPSCPARPKPKNVVIYDTCGEAERAGFRACKRCHPKRAVFRASA